MDVSNPHCLHLGNEAINLLFLKIQCHFTWMAKYVHCVGENELGHDSTIWRNRNRCYTTSFCWLLRIFFTSFLDNSHSGTMRISKVYQKHIIIHKNFTCKKEKKKPHKCFLFGWLFTFLIRPWIPPGIWKTTGWKWHIFLEGLA